jgi:hypothetical protein
MDSLAEALADASVVVFLQSSRSLESEYCKAAIDQAKTRKTPVIPLRIDDTEAERGWLMRLAGYQWLLATGDEEAWLGLLAEAINRHQGVAAPRDRGPADQATEAPNAVTVAHGDGGPPGEAAFTLERCRGLLDAADYSVDSRSAPDGRRRGRFKAGWHAAVDGRTYSEGVLAELKWDNLGWRMGKQFGDQPNEVIDAAFAAFEALWREEHP